MVKKVTKKGEEVFQAVKDPKKADYYMVEQNGNEYRVEDIEQFKAQNLGSSFKVKEMFND